MFVDFQKFNSKLQKERQLEKLRHATALLYNDNLKYDKTRVPSQLLKQAS